MRARLGRCIHPGVGEMRVMGVQQAGFEATVGAVGEVRVSTQLESGGGGGGWGTKSVGLRPTSEALPAGSTRSATTISFPAGPSACASSTSDTSELSVRSSATRFQVLVQSWPVWNER